MMRLTFLLISVLLFLSGCSSSEKKSTKANEAKSEASSQKIKSPYPTITVGKGPDAVFVTPDRNFLYVANVEDTLISVIDTKDDKVIKNISGIRNPWGFTWLGESNLVAVSGHEKQVAIIDFTTHKIVRETNFESKLGGITSSSDLIITHIYFMQ